MRRSLTAGAAFLLAALPFPPASAEVAVSIEIVRPDDGDTVSGAVLIEAETTGLVGLVAFDWSPDGGATWEAIATDAAGPPWTAIWETEDRSGPAVVRATATGGTETATDTTAVIVDNLAPTVRVDVRPSPFSPNGDGRYDVARIHVEAGEPATITLRILDPSGETLRRWSADGASELTVEWTGRASGAVRDGRYVAEATAEDAAGFRGTASAPVVVDTSPPRVRWKRLGPEPVRNAPLRFVVRVRDPSDPVRLSLSVHDAVGRVWEEGIDAPADTVRVRWRPRYRGGGRLFPGPYRAVAAARDAAGNEGIEERPFRVERPTRARVFRRVEDAGRRVALTFDDCHFHTAWARILQVLAERGVGATFFCPGTVLDPGLARRTLEEGHAVGSHGWDHANLAGRSAGETERRLRADAAAWWRLAGGTTAPYFRPPYGALDRNVVTAAGAGSHPRVIMWDVDPGDWRRPGASAIAARVVSAARPGSIVLLHTFDQTAAALPAILSGLREKGLEPVTLPELFRAGGLR